MIAAAIAFLLTNLPAVLLVLALILGAVTRGGSSTAERFLSWILLLPIGLTGVWAGIFHIFFAQRAASYIGWETSPFQFEVGMADLAIGFTACVAFHASRGFKAAAITAASVFLLGDAAGHIREMVIAGNFQPGNAGVPFYTDVLCPVLAIALLIVAPRGGRARRHG